MRRFLVALVVIGAGIRPLGAPAPDAGSALPLFGKYGLSDRVELEIGFDTGRRVDAPESAVRRAGEERE